MASRLRYLLTLFSLLWSCLPSSAQTIAVNGQTTSVTVAAGAGVELSVSDGPGNSTDWIGFFPAGAADSGYLSWTYLSGTATPPALGLTSAMVTAYAPVAPGDYEWRLFSSNSSNRVATSSTLTVTASAAVLTINGVVPPAAASVAASSAVTVGFSSAPGNSQDWITLALAGGPDSEYVDWRYLNDATVAPATGLTNGTVHFLAPGTAGTYELRLFAQSSADHLATRTLTVSAPTATITVNSISPPASISAAAGTQVSVEITGGPAQPGDWVALFPVGVSDSAYIAWRYLNGSNAIPANGQANATLTMAMPVASGSYEFRLFSAARLATSSTVVVSASAAAISVNGIATPTSVTAAPGSQAVLGISGGPANVGDWVGLFAIGESDSAYLDWRYLNDTAQLPETGIATSTLHFSVPAPLGTYEFRFFTDTGLVATSGHVVVPQTAAKISINGVDAPVQVRAAPGSTMSVVITGGPSNPTDWVALAAHDAPDSSYLAWQYLNGSTAPPATGVAAATLSVILPSTPGVYEVRLFAHNSEDRITTSGTITIESEGGPADTTPPTIIATASPAPNPAGWYNRPVTITFACADNVAVSSCPSPITVDIEGANQTISATAIDSAGNQTSTTVHVSLDRTPPSVVLPENLPSEVTEEVFDFNATIGDGLSGISAASCNGLPPEVIESPVHCSVTLRRGRNILVVSVRDAAGNAASATSRLTLISAVAATSVSVTPQSVGMLSGESRTFSVKDDQDRLLTAIWESSDTEVVNFVDGHATALSPGEATLTGTANGMSATTVVTVYPGLSMPPGAVRWSSPSIGGAPNLADTVFLGSSEVDGATILSVEYATEWRMQHLVRGLSVDGVELWNGTFPIGPTEGMNVPVADPFGGAIVTTVDFASSVSSIVRASWSEDAGTSWRHENVSLIGQARDGTIYATEETYNATEGLDIGSNVTHTTSVTVDVIGLDGQNGTERFRTRLPSFTSYQVAVNGGFLDTNVLPALDGSAISSDGYLYLTLTSGFRKDGFPGPWERKMQLMRIAPNGESTVEDLWQGSGVGGDLGGTPYEQRLNEMQADGNGGVFFQTSSNATTYPYESPVTGHYRSAAFSNDFEMPEDLFYSHVGSYSRMPYLTSIDSNSISLRSSWNGEKELISFDMRTGAVHWELDTLESATVATPGGGAVLSDDVGNYRSVDASGIPEPSTSLGVSYGLYAYGRFHARDVDGSLKALPWRPLNDATAFSRDYWFMAPAPKQYGVYAKSHAVFGIFKHSAIYVVPANQANWVATPNVWHTYFVAPKMNRFGDLKYATIAGEPSLEHIPLNPIYGYLIPRYNNADDIEKDSVDPIERLNDALDVTVSRLFTLTGAFDTHTLLYQPDPSYGYNSNSFLRGLLDAAGISHPTFTYIFGGIPNPLFPGWQKKVPAIYFGVQQ